MNTTTKRKGTENDLLAAIQRPSRQAPEPVQGGGTGGIFSAFQRNQSKAKDQPPAQAYREAEHSWLGWRRTGFAPLTALIIRAALRMKKTGAEFLNVYRQLAQMDRRFKHSARIDRRLMQ